MCVRVCVRARSSACFLSARPACLRDVVETILQLNVTNLPSLTSQQVPCCCSEAMPLMGEHPHLNDKRQLSHKRSYVCASVPTFAFSAWLPPAWSLMQQQSQVAGSTGRFVLYQLC